MRKANRLINDFKKQEKYSIWKHIEAMAVNYAVYSRSLLGVEPFLTDKDVYVYVDTENLVVVCLDCYKRHEQPTDEESEGLEPIIFREGDEPRESIVWKLKETMHMMERRLRLCHFELTVYGVLLTEANITNAEALEDVWEANHIKVFEGFKDLRHRRAAVNTVASMRARIYCDASLDSELDKELSEEEEPVKTETTKEEDEFDRLLEEFINGDLKMPTDENNTISDDENEPDDESQEELSTDTNIDDVQIPDGKIEQNQNLTVDVKILRPLANPREELDKLVGCADIKRRMDELVALMGYNKLMSEQFPGSKQHEVSLHSIFLGHPGTGKTTVCKIFGSLLHQAGALSKGHVVVCDRGTFIGTLWGDEERSVQQVLEKAKGGVLMIDEAYLLVGKNENDPGRLVLQLLMNILADESQRDIAVILCGYKDQMLKMLACNPGLESRFPNKFEFRDFTIDELLAITNSRVKEYEYQFTPEAWEKYRSLLLQAYQVRDPLTWGNARFIANQLERIYIQHAGRCVSQPLMDKSCLRQITPEDIVPIEMPRQRARIGF